MNILKLTKQGLGLASKLLLVKLGKRIPIYCEWEITSHCNMKCDFCSTWIPDRNIVADIKTEKALDIIDQLASLGTMIIHFSGGEPTMREDLLELVCRAKEHNMIVSMTTNGSASNEKIKKLLEIDLIRVSIDGIGEVHDELRRSKGAFKKAVSTIKFLIEHKKKPIITSVFSDSTNFEDLRALASFAQHYGVQLATVVLGKRISGISKKDEFTSFELFNKYVKLMKQLRKEYGNTIANPEPYLNVLQQGGLNRYGCRAADIAISIKSDGTIILPCTAYSCATKSGSIKEAYYSSDAVKSVAMQGKAVECQNCTVKCMASASALLKVPGIFSIADSYIRSF